MSRLPEHPADPDYIGEAIPDSDGYPDDYADAINGYAGDYE